MAAIEVGSEKVICYRCGKMYGRSKGNFPANYSSLYKGLRRLPICKDCLENIYMGYYNDCGDVKSAVRATCRKLNIYWSYSIFDYAEKKSNRFNIMSTYVTRCNGKAYYGKDYDDTLREENSLYLFRKDDFNNLSEDDSVKTFEEPENPISIDDTETEEEEDIEVPEEVRIFWGSGYTPGMYAELEARKQYWFSKLKDMNVEIDIGTEALIRQVCALELDINRDRSSGKSVDKSVNTLNTLIGSLNLKPAQKKQEDVDPGISNTPLGVWIYRYENELPLPEIDDDFKDVNGIRKYVFTWVTGHLAKMMGLKNRYTKMYDEAIEELRVERPEYVDEDEEDFLVDVFDSGDDGEEEY